MCKWGKSMGNVLEIKGLTKKYDGFVAVKDLTLNIGKGEIFGLLGPNGAGKTTTIRTCLDLLAPTSGKVSIFGMDSHKSSVKIRRRTGYLPGEFGLIPDITVRAFLKFLLSLSGVKDTTKMEMLAKRLDLDLTRKTNELSKGNRQKVGVVQAFMADQDLIILDEPTGGLDPLIQQEFYRFLMEEKAQGKTVFMSSHVLAEVETVCDRVAIINKGELKVVEYITNLQDKMGKMLEAEFHSPVKKEEFMMPGVSHIEVDGNKTSMIINENLDQVIKKVSDHKIVNMNLRTFNLEQLFLSYYADNGNGYLNGEIEEKAEKAGNITKKKGDTAKKAGGVA